MASALIFLVSAVCCFVAEAFSPASSRVGYEIHEICTSGAKPTSLLLQNPLASIRGVQKSARRLRALHLSDDTWSGEVVPNDGGRIKGCSIESEGTTHTISIDGVEADLGKFSQAIYKKITMDAKQQRFQGFRPGTIPPHLEPTYRAFAMDEAAREATLEAMEQNGIKPFQDARDDFEFEQISIPPPVKKKKKKGGRKKKKKSVGGEQSLQTEIIEEPEPEWLRFNSMKEALDAGWKPGQSFSFVAKDCRGQKQRDTTELMSSSPSLANLNRIDSDSLVIDAEAEDTK